MSDLKNRKRVNVILGRDFHDWLLYRCQKTGTPVSRILEIATMEKYEKEYEAFLKAREGADNEKN
jgi:hypothetical protein